MPSRSARRRCELCWSGLDCARRSNLSSVAGTGTWSIRCDAAANPIDQLPEYNQFISGSTEITSGELARHSGTPTGTLGIGAGTAAELGVQFTISQPLTVLGIRLELAAKDGATSPEWADSPIQARLRDFEAGAPDAISGAGLATTNSAPAINPAASYELPFASPVLLEAGTYVMTAMEAAGADTTLSSGTSLLEQWMSAHPDVYAFGETNRFYATQAFAIDAPLQESLDQAWFFPSKPVENASIADHYYSLSAKQGQGKAVWIEKSPAHFWHLAWIFHHFAQCACQSYVTRPNGSLFCELSRIVLCGDSTQPSNGISCALPSSIPTCHAFLARVIR